MRGQKPLTDNDYRLIEWRRYLETEDPSIIHKPQTLLNNIAAADLTLEQKLYQRAYRLDNHNQGQILIAQTTQLLAWIPKLWALFMFISGFSGTVLLLQNAEQNIFNLLLALLSSHFLLLLLWLVLLFKPLSHPPWSWRFAMNRLKKPNAEKQALFKLFSDELNQPQSRYRLGMVTHMAWLAALFGVFLALITMFSIRQYQFSWQSTLLSADEIYRLLALLSAPLRMLGLSVPLDGGLLRAERLSFVEARQWAWFVIAALLLYGLLPRALAWFYCRYRMHKLPYSLPLHLPYYRHLIAALTRQVIDPEPQSITTMPQNHAVANVLVEPILLISFDIHWPETTWAQYMPYQRWHYLGDMGRREQRMQLLTTLKNTAHPSVIIALRADRVPDRGVLRQLTEMIAPADAAAVLLVVSGKHGQAVQAAAIDAWQQALMTQAVTLLQPLIIDAAIEK